MRRILTVLFLASAAISSCMETATAQGLSIAKEQSLNRFEEWLGLQNQAGYALRETNHDLDGDETYGINGYLEDADERFDDYKTALSYHIREDEHFGGGGRGSQGGNHQADPPELAATPEAADLSPSDTPSDLPVYGEEFFYRTKLTNEVPPDKGTEDPNYIVKRGDTLKLHIWDGAEVSDRRLVTVSNTGEIDLDELGPQEVAKKTLSGVKIFLTERLRERYLNVNVTVTVAERRATQVVIAGNVNKPGIHHLAPGSTLLSAMLASGGPTRIGTYRKIILNRQASDPIEADLYDLFNEGTRTWDVELRPGDTIWVPRRGAHVRIDGEVQKPAYFELKAQTPVGEALVWSGLNGNSYTQRILIERYAAGKSQQIVAVDNKDWNDLSLAKLEEGDRIVIEPISSLIDNVVEITGNIERPGSHPWTEGMRLADLVKLGGRLLGDTDYTRVDVRRKGHSVAQYRFSGENQTTTQEQELISKNLEDVLKGNENHNIFLLPRDEVVIYNHRSTRPAPKAQITGEVYKPGDFEIRKGQRISDLIHDAGGLKPKANLAKVVLTRRKYRDFDSEVAYDVERIDIDLRTILEDPNSTDNLELENYDVLRVNRVAAFTVTVSIKGEVNAPGEYVLPIGSKISDLIQGSGGYLDTAYPKAARFYRVRVRQQHEEAKRKFVDEHRVILESQLAESLSETEYKSKRYHLAMKTYRGMLERIESTPSLGRVAVAIHESNQGQPIDDLQLEDGDTLEIPRAPSEVSIVGYVQNTGTLVYRPEFDLRDYIRLSGGLKEGANRGHIYVFKANGFAVVHNDMKRGIGARSKRLVSVINPLAGQSSIKPGDIIFVPPTFDLEDEWDFARGIIDTAFKTAITAGVIASIP